MALELGFTALDTAGARLGLRDAYKRAAGWSVDPKTWVGAILAMPEGPGFRSLSEGANTLRSDIQGTSSLLSEEEMEDLRLGYEVDLQLMRRACGDSAFKAANMVHAEVMAIQVAQERGFETRGTRMYMPWVPCTPCANAMVGAGITSLVVHQELVDKTPDRWHESTREGVEVLREAGTELLAYHGRIGGVVHQFNGQLWQP